MDAEQIRKLASLAKLEVSQETLDNTANSITNVLKLVDQLQAVDTGDARPMAHPLDAVQTLRADDVTETDQHEAFQAIAPDTESGYYLVPKVID